MSETFKQFGGFDFENLCNLHQDGHRYASTPLFNKGNIVRGHVQLLGQERLGKTLPLSEGSEVCPELTIKRVF